MTQCLFCDPCNSLHVFNSAEVERITYALTAALAIASTEHEADRLFAGEDSYTRFPCLNEVLSMSASIEGYGEHVDATVEARRNLEQAGGVA